MTQALHSLIQQIREGLRIPDNSEYEEACEVILAATESLVNAMGNAQEMVSQAKRLAEVRVPDGRVTCTVCGLEQDDDLCMCMHLLCYYRLHSLS